MADTANTEILAAKKELKRLQNIIQGAGLAPDRCEIIAPLLDNVAFLKSKLDLTRNEIGSASVVTTYDNGGGQQGEHINPIYRGYFDLLKAYISGLSLLIAQLPKEAEAEVMNETGTALELVKQMKKAAK